eukprot:8534510-Pyramimonas_sp.AAC.1
MELVVENGLINGGMTAASTERLESSGGRYVCAFADKAITKRIACSRRSRAEVGATAQRSTTRKRRARAMKASRGRTPHRRAR